MKLNTKQIYTKFIALCASNNVVKCEKLFSKMKSYGYIINIHFDNELPLITCCKKNSISVVKWLYRISIETHSTFDFNVQNNIIFRSLVKNPKVSLENLIWIANVAYLNEQPFDFSQYGKELFKFLFNHKMYEKASWIREQCNLMCVPLIEEEVGKDLYGIEPDVFMDLFV